MPGFGISRLNVCFVHSRTVRRITGVTSLRPARDSISAMAIGALQNHGGVRVHGRLIGCLVAGQAAGAVCLGDRTILCPRRPCGGGRVLAGIGEMGFVKFVFLTWLAGRESHCHGQKNCPCNVSLLSDLAALRHTGQNVNVKFTKTE